MESLGFPLGLHPKERTFSPMNEINHVEIFKQLIEQAPDAVLFADSQGVVRLWNQGAERIFGYPAEEALGQSLDLIIPERLRERHWEGYRKVMASGETHYGTDLLSVPALRNDGSQISSEFSIVMVRDDEGKVLGVAAIMRDVTAGRQREKKLKERLAALEAK